MDKRSEKALKFIDKLNKLCSQNDMRLVVYGGYAADANFGVITRAHDDIDLIVFGQFNNTKKIIELVKNSLENISNLEDIEDKGRNTYNHSLVFKATDFWIEVYYVQTKNKPNNKKYVLVKDDGTHSDTQDFPGNITTIGEYSFESQTPAQLIYQIESKINDKGYKPKEKHLTDLKKLKELVKN